MDFTYIIDNEPKYLTFRMFLKQNDFEELTPNSIHLIKGEKYQFIMTPTIQIDLENGIYECFVIFRKIKK
jgi:hypothetical protein